MEVRDELIEDIKKMHKNNGKEISDDEASEAARNVTGLVELLYKIAKRDMERQKRLKKESGGFPLETDSYSCLVCHNGMTAQNSWYNWYGQVCLLCKKAIEENIIPPFICKNDDSYFKMWEIKNKFKLSHQAVKKLISEGKLIARIILGDTGRPHEYIFLKKENPGFIERHSPEYKSHMRYRNKVSNQRTWETRQEFKTKRAKLL